MSWDPDYTEKGPPPADGPAEAKSKLAAILEHVPLERLIAELERRRQAIDTALEARLAWEPRGQALLAAAAAQWGLSSGSLFRRSRRAPVVAARQAAMTLLRESGMSYPEIAAVFQMDHGTVIHAVKCVADWEHHHKEYWRRFLAARSACESI